MRSPFTFRSLPVQMSLSFVAVVLMTAVAASIPVLWLIRDQLDRQAWSQVEQGQRTIRVVYATRRSEVVNLATVTAQRPTLNQLLVWGDADALNEYLKTLQYGAGLDDIAICETSRLIVQTSKAIDDSICQVQSSDEFYFTPPGIPAQVWMIAFRSINSEGLTAGKAVVGMLIDQKFTNQMHEQTGMDFTLLVNDQPIVTSLDTNLVELGSALQRARPANVSGDMLSRTFQIGSRSFYAARLPLDEAGKVAAEVILDVSDIAATQRRLFWILAGYVFSAALLCSVLSLLLARRVSQPLVNLAAVADRFSQGDLDSPVRLETQLREEALVAQSLENARIDLRRILTDLEREKAWINHLLESIVEGIMTLDQKQRITYFSRGAERITGWQRDQVLNRSCDDIFQPSESDLPFSQLIPDPGLKSRIPVQLTNGRQSILSVTGARLAPAEAGDAEVVLVFRDASEEESVHRLIGQFLANVAHEFRTPLSALSASIELLLDQAASFSAAEVEELLKSLHLGIISLETLVDNLLESASIEAGHFRVFPRPYDLDVIINEAASTMRPLLEKYGQHLVLQLTAGASLVQADPRRIVQVLVNLLSNASKYGPPDSPIIVEASADSRQVRVQVVDCGPGIAPEHRADVFRRFLYPRSVEPQAKVGAGLGLSVVKAVVEAHGGQVGVDSQPGGGSVFWFTLPRADEA
jgi:two-component system phosphate regulon sensor histidine kinase PhoR